jgi:DNA polymerase elongation subunit (family B)
MQFYTSIVVRGSNVLYRGYNNGIRETRKEAFAPSFYLQEPSGEYTSLTGTKLKRMDFSSILEARSFIDEYRDMDNFAIYGTADFVQQYMYETFPENVSYDFKQLKTLYIDIETECEHGFPDIATANEKIILITLKCGEETHSFTLTPCVSEDVFVHQYDTEEAMLSGFFDMVKKLDPDILTGWNIRNFDLPYIVNRAERIVSQAFANKFSPWGFLRKREYAANGRIYYSVDIPGYMVLDYIELYKKFSGTNQESYALAYISEVELGETKVDYSDYGSLREFYKKNYQRFFEYNVQDTLLVEKLEKKLRLIELAVSIAFEAKINFDGVFFSTKIWESICFDYLKDHKVVPQLKKFYDKDEQFIGAYVKEVTPGFYYNVVSFDATSLYPSIIMQFNISPDTLVLHNSKWGVDDYLNPQEDLKAFIKENTSKGHCVASNGAVFSMTKKGFIPILIERTFNQRQEAKKQMIDLEKVKEKNGDKDGSLTDRIAALSIKQSVKKILANSLYGCLGNPGFVYSSPELAVAVTMTGQYVIRTAEKKINEYFIKITKQQNLDVVIAADTDSLYINMNPIVERVDVEASDIVDFLDNSAKKAIQPVLEKAMNELGDLFGCKEKRLQFKREVIATSGIFKAKKRYALCVFDKEGVRFTEPKVKIMGMETARSSTPHLVRENLKIALKIMLTKNNEALINFISKFREEFFAQPIEKISSPRKIAGMNTYCDRETIYRKSTPIATKAALLYNYQIKKLGLEEKHSVIGEGDKIKFIHLKVPNPYGRDSRERVIGFQNVPPKEFNLEKFADFEMQFEKTFLEPLRNVTEVIGWTTDTNQTLESFFE